LVFNQSDLSGAGAENHRADINTLGVVATEAAYRQGSEWLDQLLVIIDANHSFVESYCTVPGGARCFGFARMV
jgi:bifunctional pyridoxal-dependent enzyme with beta-cystathionase and maltose regulon repressor activities